MADADRAVFLRRLGAALRSTLPEALASSALGPDPATGFCDARLEMSPREKLRVAARNYYSSQRFERTVPLLYQEARRQYLLAIRVVEDLLHRPPRGLKTDRGFA